MTLEKTLMKHEFCFEVAMNDVKTDVTTSLPASQVFTESYLALSVYGSAYCLLSSSQGECIEGVVNRFSS